MLKFISYISLLFILSVRLYADNLQAPVNAIYDPINSRYLVTQTNNQLVALDKEMQNAETLLTLNSPAELYTHYNKLYIADMNIILEYNIENMQELSRHELNTQIKIKTITGDGNDNLYFVNANDNKFYKYNLTNSELTEIVISSNTLTITDIDYMTESLYCAVIENSISKVIEYDLQTNATDILYSNQSLIGINGIAHDDNYIYAYYFGSGINKGVINRINPISKQSVTIKSDLPIYSSFEYSIALQSLIVSQTSKNALALYLVGVADSPDLLYPENNSSIEENKVIFRWQAISPAVALYEFNVSEDTNFVENVRSYTYQTNQSTFVVLDTSKVYFWRVRGINLGVNGQWSDTYKFKTGNMSYGAPKLITPATNATNIGILPTFVWSKSPAGIYALQISKILDFSTIEYEVSNLIDTVFTISEPLSANTEYFWRVRAYSSLESPIVWSNPSAFSTFNSVPEPPVLYYPLNMVINVSKTPTLEWNSVANTNSYEVWLSDHQEFIGNSTKIYEVESKPNSSKQSLHISDTLKNTWYYFWKVRGINDYGDGQWSETWGFVTINSGGNPGSVIENPEIINAYPNPADDFVSADIALPIGEEFKIELVNSLGATIETPKYEIINQDNSIKISTASLVSGIYFGIVKSSNKSYILKIVKQ